MSLPRWGTAVDQWYSDLMLEKRSVTWAFALALILAVGCGQSGEESSPPAPDASVDTGSEDTNPLTCPPGQAIGPGGDCAVAGPQDCVAEFIDPDTGLCAPRVNSCPLGQVAVMDEGRILQMDTPRQIYERPKSREVADFIGQMNLLKGTVESVEEKVSVRAPTLGRVSVSRNDQDVAVGDPVTLAVRPENLILKSSSEPGAVRVTLAASAFWGHTTYYRVIVSGAEDESLDVAQQDYDGSGKTGDQARLCFDSEDLLLLKN